MIVPARGITGGISIAVWNFGTSAGLSVPPGIWAMARSIQPACVATYHPIVDAPVSLKKFRRVSIIQPPVWAPLSLGVRLARRCRSASTAPAWNSGSRPWRERARIRRSTWPPVPSGGLAPPERSSRSECASRQAGFHWGSGSQSWLAREVSVEVKVADLDDIRAQAAPHQREDLAGDVVGLIAAPWAFKHLALLSVVPLGCLAGWPELSDPVTRLTRAGRPISAVRWSRTGGVRG